MNEFEFILEDRIAKIQAINKQYDLENNSYISFSGGKDSCVLSELIDIALPNNNIPRVYANTGIEYLLIQNYVRDRERADKRFVILNQTRNIRKTLNEYGYPFKSKEHSLRVEQFNKGMNSNWIKRYISGYEHNGKLTTFRCPDCLKYQFEEKGKYNYSSQCCYKLKKSLMHKYQKENNLKMVVTGMRNDEGGNRARLTCLTDKETKFHPLIVVNEEWEEWFINKYNVKLCELYYPPYNFKRTGCVGCPYSLQLQKNLLTLKKLLPNEYKRAINLWKPVYDEYVRIGYRLDKDFYDKGIQYTIFDYKTNK